MLSKPSITASEEEIFQFVHEWIKLCALGMHKEAFSILDSPLKPDSHEWGPEDIREITFDHFDDEKYPVITDPDKFISTIKKYIYKYDDDSGWAVEYDLPLNGVMSDFTLMFDFIKDGEYYKVILDDCHVM
ncbi:hypothetical protein [Pseudoalteromonas sp. McH1-42]|uniref:DUF7668 domain-containing protein n=1 Tax=Pseudoalteromonas sp. McH1-42 TaxID=2917752 RepID=UPI001EF65631|nr:hypothetical protein [Pseudoalteromonas sp. McH1-42]MCG7564205.1 hypothetical protein [Pseudoalteromonas sp. McH1-42]